MLPPVAASPASATEAVSPFLVCGAASVVVGGLVAAATSPLRLDHGSWAAAYLVLVNGVAQIALDRAQHALASNRPSKAIVGAELAAWNLAGLAVVGGTLIRQPLVVDVGGVLLIVALALMIRTVRGRTAGPRWALVTYRLLLVIVLASIPVGLILAHVRAS